MAMTETITTTGTTFSDNVKLHATTGLYTTHLGVMEPNPPPKNMPPEVRNMLAEKRRTIYALKLLLKAEEDALSVYERMLDG